MDWPPQNLQHLNLKQFLSLTRALLSPKRDKILFDAKSLVLVHRAGGQTDWQQEETGTSHHPATCVQLRAGTFAQPSIFPSEKRKLVWTGTVFDNFVRFQGRHNFRTSDDQKYDSGVSTRTVVAKLFSLAREVACVWSLSNVNTPGQLLVRVPGNDAQNRRSNLVRHSPLLIEASATGWAMLRTATSVQKHICGVSMVSSLLNIKRSPKLSCVVLLVSAHPLFLHVPGQPLFSNSMCASDRRPPLQRLCRRLPLVCGQMCLALVLPESFCLRCVVWEFWSSRHVRSNFLCHPHVNSTDQPVGGKWETFCTKFRFGSNFSAVVQSWSTVWKHVTPERDKRNLRIVPTALAACYCARIRLMKMQIYSGDTVQAKNRAVPRVFGEWGCRLCSWRLHDTNKWGIRFDFEISIWFELNWLSRTRSVQSRFKLLTWHVLLLETMAEPCAATFLTIFTTQSPLFCAGTQR